MQITICNETISRLKKFYEYRACATVLVSCLKNFAAVDRFAVRCKNEETTVDHQFDIHISDRI